MNHHVIVRNRAISVVGPVMVQSNVAVDTVTVSVDSEYDGLQVALVIGGTQIMYDGEPVTVPPSELERAGDLPLTVLGLSSGKRVVTASAESAFRVVASGAFEGEDPVPDSPDMLQQLADAYKAANEAAGTATEAAKAAQDAVAEVDEAVSDLGDAAANAAAAGESAEAAAKSASDAKASESSARASAESARADAGSASSSATAARQSATEAASSAAAASQSATEAKASADSASADARTASQSASMASSAASSANGDAAGAQSAADAAQAAAASAQEDASAARTAAETATTRAQAASSSASAAAQSATDAKASADLAAGWVPADGEPGQLLAKTDSGTAWVDPPSGNVLVGTATGYVAHAEDAYAAKPREVRVKGRTVKNLWPAINGTSNGVTVSTDKTGLITVSGTATADATITAEAAYAPSSAYVMASTYGSPSTWHIVNGETQVASGMKLAVPSATCGVTVKSGAAVDASFRVMLVEGSEAPDCFTPTGLHSVEPKKLVTAGKNLLAMMGRKLPYTDEGITFSDNGDGGIRISGTATADSYYNFFNSPKQAPFIPAGTYTANLTGRVGGVGLTVGLFDGGLSGTYTSWIGDGGTKPATGTLDSPKYLRPYLFVHSGTTVDVVVYPQLEIGSTATAYEPPNVTTTPLPEVGLRSLPDGTCDELVIGADGTCEVERRTQLTGDEVTALPEPTTETLDAVSLPKLPAPTFNIYHDSQVPSDTSVEYERDVNIAYAELEAKIAALTVAQATS